jgi:zinc transporter ZupT
LDDVSLSLFSQDFGLKRTYKKIRNRFLSPLSPSPSHIKTFVANESHTKHKQGRVVLEWGWGPKTDLPKTPSNALGAAVHCPPIIRETPPLASPLTTSHDDKRTPPYHTSKMAQHDDDDYIVHKLVIALTIAVVSFVSAVAPMKVIHLDAHLFSVGNLLSSGILLSAGLVHQLAGSVHKIESSLADSSIDMKFPLGPFVSGLTFCAFLILEEFLHTQLSDRHFPADHQHQYHHHDDNPDDNDVEDNQHNHNHNHNNDLSQLQYPQQEFSLDCESAPLLFPPPIPPPQFTANDPILIQDLSHSGLSTTASSSSRQHHHHPRQPRCAGAITCRHESFMTMTISHPDQPPLPPQQQGEQHCKLIQSFRSPTFALEHQHHHHQDHVDEHMHGSLLASIILLFALSIHSILEGLAIGISNNHAEVLSTTTAVLAHKAFASYALGSSMVASQMKEGHFLVIVLVFSICSVLGIFLGMAFEQVTRNATNQETFLLATGLIQAVVAGTFLFVSIVEIGLKEILLCRESKWMGDKMSRREMEWTKLAAFLIGYLAMSSLAVVV